MPPSKYKRKKVVLKKTTKRPTKRVYNPKTTYVKTNVSLGLGFPKKMTMTHRYNETVPVAISSGFVTQYAFSTLNMYDPNVTGTGHQPLNYDTMAGIYDHWTVIGSKIDVKIVPTNVGNGAVVGVYLDDGTSMSAATNYQTFAEQNTSKFKYITQGYTLPTSLAAKYSAHKTFGKGVLANCKLLGGSSTSPTETHNYLIWVAALDNSAAITAFIDVTITYIAVWTERHSQVTS